jgi:hypothetical protein
MAPDPAVPAAAILADTRKLIRARDELVARMHPGRSYGAAEFSAAQDRLAERVPLLLAAVEAVLKAADEWMNTSWPDDGGDRAGVATEQIILDGIALREAIVRALAGKESSDEQ